MRTCVVSNRDTDPPMQKLLHTVYMLCIDYYAACQRKNRANRWNNCHPHSQVERPRQQAQGKNMSGFRDFVHALLAFGISSLDSGRGGPRYSLRWAAKRIKKRAVRAYRLGFLNGVKPQVTQEAGRPQSHSGGGLGHGVTPGCRLAQADSPLASIDHRTYSPWPRSSSSL
jgi:hypothetical protein